jgi:Legume lectin domain/Chitobiase/beta-hexosaminidase C-terminal domain
MMYQARTLTVVDTLLALIAIAALAGCAGQPVTNNGDSNATTAGASTGGSTAASTSAAPSASTASAATTTATSQTGSSVAASVTSLYNNSTSSSSGSGASVVLNYPSGFASAGGALRTTSNAAMSGAVANLTSWPTQHQAGGVGYTSQVDVTSFTSDFTFLITPTGTIPSIQGMTFVVQNSPQDGPCLYGAGASTDANMLGYGDYNLSGQCAVQKSVAVKFDLNSSAQQNYPVGGAPSSTGMYINGGPFAALIPQNDLNPFGINLNTGHIMAAHVVYDGALLTMVLRDTVTGTQVRESWPVNIPAVVGGNNAYVGFTAGEIPASTPQEILSWTFSEGYSTRLATPTFSVGTGTYASSQSVSISAPAGATVYYTTNGQQPTTSSTKYTGPIAVSSAEVIEAVAVESGYTDSLVGVANYQIGAAGTPLINFPSSMAGASNLITVNGTAHFNGSALQLTDSTNNDEAASAWYSIPVNVQSFTTHFTLQLLNPTGNGMTFTIQNQTPASADTSSQFVSGGPTAIASDTGLGYSGSTGATGGQIAGLTSSVAVKFGLFGGTGDETALLTNGVDPSTVNVDMSSSGLLLHSGNPLAVTMVYDGTTLTMTITDTKTSASFTKSWTINIPATVGGNTAYVGFTGSTGGATAQQSVIAWTYAN